MDFGLMVERVECGCLRQFVFDRDFMAGAEGWQGRSLQQAAASDVVSQDTHCGVTRWSFGGGFFDPLSPVTDQEPASQSASRDQPPGGSPSRP